MTVCSCGHKELGGPCAYSGPDQPVATSAPIPELLTGVVPSIGSVWLWEPLKPHASERVRVTDVRWNGEAVWVASMPVGGGREVWNELDRWVEATVLVESTDA